jgi:VWFA-related protein
MSRPPWTTFAPALLGASVWLGGFQGAAAGSQQPPAPPDVRSYGVDVGLVRLSVTARTPGGSLVHDLALDQFQVFEAGERQEVVRFGHHETPISVVVLFDKSASMRGEKLMHAKDAVVNFVRAFGAQDEVLVVAFSGGIDVLGDFGLDTRTIERATKRIQVESGTRLYDATIEGARAIAGPGRKEKRALLILSDGEDTASLATLDDAAEAVRRAGIPVYAIAIEMDPDDPTMWADPPSPRSGWPDSPPLGPDPLWKRRNPSPRKRGEQPSSAIRALTRLTEGTGGWTYPVTAAKRCKEVCIRVAEELRHQYLLGYQPGSQGEDGGWRSVEVRTTAPGVVLSTRSGYLAAAR